MADYLGGYTTAMDREYFEPLSDSEKEPLVPMGSIGISTNPTTDQLEQLKVRIFQGASQIELGFSGAGKSGMGAQGGTTPETYDAEKRGAMRELAEFNRVKMTTHATLSQGSLAGLDREGFSDDSRQRTLFEIQKTIDFAADVARGGPVVLHAWEWQRPVSLAGSKYNDGKFEEYDFSDYSGKKEDRGSKHMVIPMADEKTGALSGVPTDYEVYEPKIDEEKSKKLGFNVYELNKKGEIISEKKNYDQIIAEAKKEYEYNKESGLFSKDGIDYTSEQIFMKKYFRNKYDLSQAQSKQYREELDSSKKKLEDINEKISSGKEILMLNSENKPEIARPEQINDLKKELKNRIEYYQEISSAHQREADQILRSAERLKPIEEVGLKKTAQTIAMSAVYAYDKQTEMEKNGTKFQSDLFIAPENVFPEQYGAHPQELKKIVQESREAMTNYLVNHKKIDRDKAKKISESRIKATFDIGHAYTWKKYFKGDEKEFNSWLLKEVDDLTKNNIIGHVHISDNMGYDDEHLIPGEGKVPILEFMKRIKDKNISKTVEVGPNDYKGMIGAWNLFGNPITGLSGSRTDRWTNVENSYFGQTKSPYFVFGEYAPSEEYRGSPFWTGLPLE